MPPRKRLKKEPLPLDGTTPYSQWPAARLRKGIADLKAQLADCNGKPVEDSLIVSFEGVQQTIGMPTPTPPAICDPLDEKNPLDDVATTSRPFGPGDPRDNTIRELKAKIDQERRKMLQKYAGCMTEDFAAMGRKKLEKCIEDVKSLLAAIGASVDVDAGDSTVGHRDASDGMLGASEGNGEEGNEIGRTTPGLSDKHSSAFSSRGVDTLMVDPLLTSPSMVDGPDIDDLPTSLPTEVVWSTADLTAIQAEMDTSGSSAPTTAPGTPTGTP